MRTGLLLVFLLACLPLTGCLGDDASSDGDGERYTVDATLSRIEVEAKTAYYQDEEAVSWSIESSSVGDALENSGGNVVGVFLSLTYGEDESPAGPLCTGDEADAPDTITEADAPDTITGSATKGEWALSASAENPGAHEVNLTWYNESLLSGVIEGLTVEDIEAQLAFGEDALGVYDLSITVDAAAFNGALCSHDDEGEEVTTVVSLLVLDFSILNEEGDALTTMAVGDGSIPVFMFAAWIFPVVFLVGYISVNQRERFHLDVDFAPPEETLSADGQSGASSSDGETLVDSYRARVLTLRVLTLSALYVAQGVPWGFITVTMVTFLAAEGADAGDLAYLLTLGTLPWSFKFLWGPVIDRFQKPEFGRRRPWILIAQTGMVALLVTMLLVPDLSNNISLLGALFFVYNVNSSGGLSSTVSRNPNSAGDGRGFSSPRPGWWHCSSPCFWFPI